MKEDFLADARYGEALQTHCDLIVPMNDLKWEAVHPERNRYAFEDADNTIAFAKKHGKAVRGHALLWYNAMPSWTKTIETRRDAETILRQHIGIVASRYRSTIGSWDVVNEVIAHDPARQGPMRDTMWQRLLGTEHVAIAFKAAQEAAPDTELVLNDYDFEFDEPHCVERRRQALNLVRMLQAQNIRIDAVGLQAHLYGEKRIDRAGLSRFAAALRSLGVKLHVTELDVIDWKLPASIRERDRVAAEQVDTLLSSIGEGAGLHDVITWGISDRFSWIREVFPRSDGLPNRPLPLDADFRPKPMLEVIRKHMRKA